MQRVPTARDIGDAVVVAVIIATMLWFCWYCVKDLATWQRLSNTFRALSGRVENTTDIETPIGFPSPFGGCHLSR